MSTANGGQVAQSNGNDLLFTAGDGITKLNHELEMYNESTGTLVAWVQIPSLSPTADTTFYVYYGNAGAPSQQNPSGVWDANYKGVWHFGDGTTLSANESTSDGYNGSIVNATAAAGSVGGAASFQGPSASIHVDPNVTTTTAAATISFWINPSSVATSNSIYGTYSTDSRNNSGTMSIDMGEPYCGQTTNIRFILGGAACTTSNILAAGVWTYVTIVYDGTQPSNTMKMKIYSNGVAQTVSDGGVAIRPTINIVDLHHRIGSFNNSQFNGLLDEVRLSDSIRSPAWITTEYNNQSAPSTFAVAGPQQ